jgi:hypothetical protein
MIGVVSGEVYADLFFLGSPATVGELGMLEQSDRRGLEFGSDFHMKAASIADEGNTWFAGRLSVPVVRARDFRCVPTAQIHQSLALFCIPADPSQVLGDSAVAW